MTKLPGIVPLILLVPLAVGLILLPPRTRWGAVEWRTLLYLGIGLWIALFTAKFFILLALNVARVPRRTLGPTEEAVAARSAIWNDSWRSASCSTGRTMRSPC